MNIENDYIKGGLCLVLFVVWHIKMYTHFEYLKGKGKIHGDNYLRYLFDPFGSGFYYMVIVCPFVFAINKDKHLKNSFFLSLLIWFLFIIIVVF